MNGSKNEKIIETGEATGIIPCDGAGGRPITVIGTQLIRDGFEEECLRQARNSRAAPGVVDVVLNPDAHRGYGAPIGCVLVSPSHIYPGPVGVDIKCSMSLLQLDLPAEAVEEKPVRRALIDAILERTPTGAGKGQRSVKKARRVDEELGRKAAVEGASREVCDALAIPPDWAERCEDACLDGHDGTPDSLAARLDDLRGTGAFSNFSSKIRQLGSYGSGNHFGECEIVQVAGTERAREAAAAFGLEDGKVAFLSHCGSRGFGYHLAYGQFKALQAKFEAWGIPYPGGDRQLVYAPIGTLEANAYLDDMALGGNFSTVNHLLINSLVLEAFQEVLPGVTGRLVYTISHNFARLEVVGGRPAWVHRKGATRAYPGGHFALKGTPYAETGHPILLPGNPLAGSVVMVGEAGAEKSCYSVNHGAGRAMGRKKAYRSLDQKKVDAGFLEEDVLFNCRRYPRDEAPAAYKDFGEVVQSVECAGLASVVARLKARFVIKDEDKSRGGTR